MYLACVSTLRMMEHVMQTLSIPYSTAGPTGWLLAVATTSAMNVHAIVCINAAVLVMLARLQHHTHA